MKKEIIKFINRMIFFIWFIIVTYPAYVQVSNYNDIAGAVFGFITGFIYYSLTNQWRKIENN